jgi:hypothetical protein
LLKNNRGFRELKITGDRGILNTVLEIRRHKRGKAKNFVV